MRGAGREIEHLQSNDLVLLIVIKNQPGRNLLRLHDLRLVQPEVKGICFRIHSDFHNFPFIALSKNTLNILGGTNAMFTTTRNTRSPNSGILPNLLSNNGFRKSDCTIDG